MWVSKLIYKLLKPVRFMDLLDFPKFRQRYEYDCGAKLLQSVLAYYGMEIREELIAKEAKTNEKSGTLIKNILKVLDKYGLKYDSKSMTIKDLKKYVSKKIPVMLLLQAWSYQNLDYSKTFESSHWVAVIGFDKGKVIFEDPYSFKLTYLTENELDERWHGRDDNNHVNNHGLAVYGKKPEYDSKKIIHMD
ncbi:hypothetical protein COU54_00530 [Candidatus Pacearchaeota archaeon CG10_big_fil_rev_8_21_14_0_10_31_24]|nr:MAG: hypothetical protein COU54_00530 [Candidatus Pacearchaeota archaeon CG10_big_fil_rev_8_21_14_0_10_31_24]